MLPYVITGFLLIVIGVAFNIYVITRRGVAPGMSSDDDDDVDKKKDGDEGGDIDEDGDEGGRSKTGRASLVFTAWLFASIFALVGLGLVANYGIRAGLTGAVISTEGFVNELEINFEESVRFVLRAGEKVGDVGKGSEGEEFESFRGVLDGVMEDVGIVEGFLKESFDVGMRIVDDFNLTKLVVNLGVSLLLFAFFLALGFVFTTNLISVHSHVTRVVLLILFLLPLGVSWCMTGFLTTAGVISADFCVSLRDYHLNVLDGFNGKGDSGTQPDPDNVFLQSGLECPRFNNSEAIESLSDFFIVEKTNEGIEKVGALATAFGVNETVAESTLVAAGWNFGNLTSCEAGVRWAARMHYHMCGDFNGSLVASVLLLWLIFIALSILLLLVFITAMTGFAVAEFATGYEMMRVHGLSPMLSEDEFSDVEDQTLRQQLNGERSVSHMRSQPSFFSNGGSRPQSSFFGSATPQQRSSFYGGAVRSRNGSASASAQSSGKLSKPRKQSSKRKKYLPFSEVEGLPSRDQANFFNNNDGNSGKSGGDKGGGGS